MILYIFKKLFKVIIGDIPPNKQAELWLMFNSLLIAMTKAAAEGATKDFTENSTEHLMLFKNHPERTKEI